MGLWLSETWRVIPCHVTGRTNKIELQWPQLGTKQMRPNALHHVIKCRLKMFTGTNLSSGRMSKATQTRVTVSTLKLEPLSGNKRFNILWTANSLCCDKHIDCPPTVGCCRSYAVRVNSRGTLSEQATIAQFEVTLNLIPRKKGFQFYTQTESVTLKCKLRTTYAHCHSLPRNKRTEFVPVAGRLCTFRFPFKIGRGWWFHHGILRFGV